MRADFACGAAQAIEFSAPSSKNGV